MLVQGNRSMPRIAAALLLALATSGREGLAAGALNAASKHSEEVCLVQSMVKVTEGHKQEITIVGMETRDTRTSIPFMGALGLNVTNLGAGRHWQGWKNRMAIYVEAVEKLAKQDAMKMLIVTDVADMVYGGCRTDEMLEYYNDLVQQTGAAVVYGGSVYCYPPIPEMEKDYLKLLPRMRAVQDRAGLPRSGYCSETNNLAAKWGSPGYLFLNAGFVMGPAGKLSEVLQGALAVPCGRAYDDQLTAATFMLQNPDKVTVDYTGRIVLTANGKLFGCRKEALFTIEKDRLVNKVTNRTACFVHGAGGHGIETLQEKGLVDFATHVS